MLIAETSESPRAPATTEPKLIKKSPVSRLGSPSSLQTSRRVFEWVQRPQGLASISPAPLSTSQSCVWGSAPHPRTHHPRRQQHCRIPPGQQGGTDSRCHGGIPLGSTGAFCWPPQSSCPVSVLQILPHPISPPGSQRSARCSYLHCEYERR